MRSFAIQPCLLISRPTPSHPTGFSRVLVAFAALYAMGEAPSAPTSPYKPYAIQPRHLNTAPNRSVPAAQLLDAELLNLNAQTSLPKQFLPYNFIYKNWGHQILQTACLLSVDAHSLKWRSILDEI